MKRPMDEYVEVVRNEIWNCGTTKSAVEKLIRLICKDEGLELPVPLNGKRRRKNEAKKETKGVG